MGASDWDYYARYQPDIEAVFAQLQDEVLQSGDFQWNDEWYGPRPTTRWQLSAFKDRDEFWDEGTHSILDMDRIISADADTDTDTDTEDETGAIRPLTADEMEDYFGSTRPTEKEFEGVYLEFGEIVDIPRWTGRYVVLYKDDQPHQIAFFGVSGD